MGRSSDRSNLNAMNLYQRITTAPFDPFQEDDTPKLQPLRTILINLWHEIKQSLPKTAARRDREAWEEQARDEYRMKDYWELQYED